MPGIPPEVAAELEKVLADSTPTERCANRAGYLMGLAFAVEVHKSDADPVSEANLAVLGELVKALGNMRIAMMEME